MPYVGPPIIVGPEVHPPTIAEPAKVGAKVLIQDSPEGSGKIFLSTTDPVSLIGFEDGDLWLNTETGVIFRLEL